MRDEFPSDEMVMSHILVVDDLSASVSWYRDVLGAQLFREYGGTTAVFEFNGTWLLLVTGAGPTPDKPAVTMTAPTDVSEVHHAFTIRVPDCEAAYGVLSDRGAMFMTPPYERPGEVRCFFEDPDGHLFEISEFVAG